MKNRDITANCSNCRYGNVSILSEPCRSCDRILGPNEKWTHWRKERFWKSAVFTYILAAVLILAVIAAAVLIGRTTANAAGPSPDPVELAARQEEVHAAAELLRSLGVDEDDQAIQVLSAEWWRCETLKSARYLGVYTVTGYDVYCKHCCARADGITASGAVVTEGYTVAMCRDFPFGTKVYIEGLGIYEVQDRGVGPGKIDIALGSHKECYAVTGRYKVWVIENGT